MTSSLLRSLLLCGVLTACWLGGLRCSAGEDPTEDPFAAFEELLRSQQDLPSVPPVDIRIGSRRAAWTPPGRRSPSGTLRGSGTYESFRDDSNRFVFLFEASEVVVRGEAREGGKLRATFEASEPSWPRYFRGTYARFRIEDGRVVELREYRPEPIVSAANMRPIPRIYQVLRKNLDTSGSSLNVLFVGDSFTEDQVKTGAYRETVLQLALSIVDSPLFCHYRSQLAFYRIDVVDASKRVQTGLCPRECPNSAPVTVEHGYRWEDLVVAEGEATLDVDLGAERCWTEMREEGVCKMLWVEDRDAVLALGRGVKDLPIHVVVMVVDGHENAAAGLLEGGGVSCEDPPCGLSVIGVAMDEKGSLTEDTKNLFAHEFGHALGLLDEHLEGSPRELPSIPANIWANDHACPWLGEVTEECEVGDLVPCAGEGTECALCMRNPRRCPCRGKAVMYQGAYYDRDKFFRNEFRCRMRVDIDKHFCTACAWVVRRTFRNLTGAKDLYPNLGDTLAACPEPAGPEPE